jgi:hypothetical protein
MAYINSEYAFVVDPNADGEGPSSLNPGTATGGGYGGKGAPDVGAGGGYDSKGAATGGGYGGKGGVPFGSGNGGVPSYADSYGNTPTPFYSLNFSSAAPPPKPVAPAHAGELFQQVPGAYVPTAADLAAFEIQNVTTYDSKSGQASGTAKVASLKDPSILENNDALTGSFDDMVNQLTAIYSTAILHDPLSGAGVFQVRTDADYDPNVYNPARSNDPYSAVDYEDHAALLAALTQYTNEFPTLRGYILDHIPGGRISYDSKSGQSSGQLPPGSTQVDYLRNYVNFMRETVLHPEMYYAEELKRVAYDMGYDKNKDFTNAEIQSFVQPALRYLSAELVQKFVSEAFSKGAKDRAEDDSFFGLGKEFGIIAAVVLSLTGAGAAIGGLITGATGVSAAIGTATVGNIAVGTAVNAVVGNIVVGTILNGGDFGAAVKGGIIGGVANVAGGLVGGFAQGATAGVEGLSSSTVGLIASTGAQITTSALLNGGSVGGALMRGGVSAGIATLAGGILGDGDGTGPNLTTGVANLVTQQIFDGRIDPISAAMAFAPTGRVTQEGSPDQQIAPAEYNENLTENDVTFVPSLPTDILVDSAEGMAFLGERSARLDYENPKGGYDYLDRLKAPNFAPLLDNETSQELKKYWLAQRDAGKVLVDPGAMEAFQALAGTQIRLEIEIPGGRTMGTANLVRVSTPEGEAIRLVTASHVLLVKGAGELGMDSRIFLVRPDGARVELPYETQMTVGSVGTSPFGAAAPIGLNDGPESSRDIAFITPPIGVLFDAFGRTDSRFIPRLADGTENPNQPLVHGGFPAWATQGPDVNRPVWRTNTPLTDGGATSPIVSSPVDRMNPPTTGGSSGGGYYAKNATGEWVLVGVESQGIGLDVNKPANAQATPGVATYARATNDPTSPQGFSFRDDPNGETAAQFGQRMPPKPGDPPPPDLRITLPPKPVPAKPKAS